MVIREKDTILNFDKWKTTKGNNILFITGYSGSGKTTLGESFEKKYNAYLFEIDGIEFNYDSSNKGILTKSLKKYPEYKDVVNTKKWRSNGKKYVSARVKILNEALCTMYDDSSVLYIVEGIQVFWDMDINIIADKPLIIKNTSAIKSLLRRLKRNSNGGHINCSADSKHNFLLLCKTYFLSRIKLNKFKKDITRHYVTTVFSDVIKINSIPPETNP